MMLRDVHHRARTTRSSTRCIDARSTSSTSASKKRRRHRHVASASNQGAQFVRHLENMLVLARVIAQGALQPRRVARRALQARVPRARRRELPAHHAGAPQEDGRRRTTCASSTTHAPARRARHRRGRHQPRQAARSQVRAGRRGQRRGHAPSGSRRRSPASSRMSGDRHGSKIVQLKIKRQDGPDKPRPRAGRSSRCRGSRT